MTRPEFLIYKPKVYRPGDVVELTPRGCVENDLPIRTRGKVETYLPRSLAVVVVLNSGKRIVVSATKVEPAKRKVVRV